MLIIGFDAEWKNQGESNQVLSYQFYAHHTINGSWDGIYLPEAGKRVTLKAFLRWAIQDGRQRGVLRKWPSRLYIVGHFAISDLAIFADFNSLKMEFDSIRRTYVTLDKDYELNVTDEHNHTHKIKVTLRDSFLLAPAGKHGLDDLGELVNLPKVKLPAGAIENMDVLLEEQGELFEEYALRDPRVAVDYLLRMLRLNMEINQDPEIPMTLSSMGMAYLLKLWRERSINKQAVLGTELKKCKNFNTQTGRYYTPPPKEVLTVQRHRYESAVNECYHGGRNEQYFFGAGARGEWTDYDLCGAYATAMSVIGMPLWKDIRKSVDLKDFGPDVMGYADIQFTFPTDTRFPCLPVRTDYGLIFPLAGETSCGAPEIYLAQQLGAKITVIDGTILPSSMDVQPFQEFIIECTKRRKEFPKDSLENLFWKELTNGTYGKTAQGLRPKRCFDTRVGQSRQLPPSKISNPYLAAFVTSFVRAALGEIIAKLPLHVAVCNATTDGFLSTATEAEVCAATSGEICKLFSRARLQICGDAAILEAKHRIAQPLGWRTRGQATISTIAGEPADRIVLAKAGIKAPINLKDKRGQNDWIIDQFIERHAASKYTIEPFRSVRALWHNGGDFVRQPLERRLSMEFDWKRCDVAPTLRGIGKEEHLFFDTRPWASPEAHLACRTAWEKFNSHERHILRTVADLNDFREYRELDLTGTELKKPRTGGFLTLARRMFLRAWTRAEWGIIDRGMSYSALADWLTQLGYETDKYDVENANRKTAKLETHLVPPSPAVLKFVADVRTKFPEFDASQLLRREGDLPEATALHGEFENWVDLIP